MAIPKLHGTFKLPNPRVRTQRTALAMRSRPKMPRKRLDQGGFRDEVFPTKRRPFQHVPDEYITVLVANRILRQRGSVKLPVLVGILGAVPGFLLGSSLQFDQLKEYIAKAAGLGLEQLSYGGFLANPGLSVKDYASMMAAGAVGAFFTGGLAGGLTELLGQGQEL